MQRVAVTRRRVVWLPYAGPARAGFPGFVGRSAAVTTGRAMLALSGAVIALTFLLAAPHSRNRLRVSGLVGLHLIQASFTGLYPVVATLKRFGMKPGRAFG